MIGSLRLRESSKPHYYSPLLKTVDEDDGIPFQSINPSPTRALQEQLREGIGKW